MRGLKPHTREERLTLAHGLIAPFQAKFGDDLLAIALAASVARNADRAYSDLEMIVFLRVLPESGQRYLQRVYDGILVEVLYTAAEHYLELWRTLSGSWWQGGSEPLTPLVNAPYIEWLLEQRATFRHPRAAYLRRAARKELELLEATAKVLNAIDAENREGLPLLLFEMLMALLATLAYLNERPFTTLALYLSEARQFTLKPPRYHDLLDRISAGNYDDLPDLRALCETILSGTEALFVADGYVLYDETLDPAASNRDFTS